MDATDSVGKLVLRLTIGGLILLHGVHKLLNGIGGIEDGFVSHGLPGAIAYAVYLGEVLGPLLVIVGLFARIGGLLIVANMVVAVLLVHMSMLFTLNGMGGYALELQACYLFGGLAIALLGAGPISIGGENGRWN